MSVYKYGVANTKKDYSKIAFEGKRSFRDFQDPISDFPKAGIINSITSGYIEHELEVARKIQINLLPSQCTGLKGLESACFYEPAHIVGGDYYDMLELDESHKAFLIGDVSGKGVPASMLMVMIRSIIHYAAQHKVLDKTEAVITELNEYLRKCLMDSMFVTLFMGVLDEQNDMLSFCNAGHNYPLIFNGDKEFLELNSGGLMLGMFDGAKYSRQEARFRYGDLLAMYTDGITDAIDSEGTPFGADRLKRFLRDHYRKGIELNALIDEFKDYYYWFVDPRQKLDDATLILSLRSREQN
ncbi:MAG: PP2C family protein-serine/threonine phosphatase [Candidatus Wallbacteria bacterium]|nr:PP2C family protein-serine/threonine phosphatase [Candidatus Wallbacteria bacterium]